MHTKTSNGKIKTKIKKNKANLILITFSITLIVIGSVSFGAFFGLYSVQTGNDLANFICQEKKDSNKKIKLFKNTKNKNNPVINSDLFSEVWNSLKNEYVDHDKLNEKDMLYGSINGLVASTKDPYTIFMNPKEAEQFDQDMSGTFEGIGAEIGLKDNVITVVAPLEGMPAEIAGIKSGDQIISINKEATAGLSVYDAVQKIRGKKGTNVTLTINRNGEKKLKEITITRNTITVKSVKTEVKNGILIIKVSSFNKDTDELFSEAVNKALTLNPKGVILDLRNNPGGYLESAIAMSSEWIDKGVVVTEKFSNNKTQSHESSGLGRLKDFKTVVLINSGSASSSEIVAGALKDHKKATIVGQKSFGKGSVQTLKGLSDGSALKITTAKWSTPSGKQINEIGIMPDVSVDLTQKDYNANLDPQLKKAMEIISTNK